MIPGKELTTINYKIELNGIPLLPQVRSMVTRVEFVEEVNLPSMFRIFFATGSLGDLFLKFLTMEVFDIGTEVKLYLGSGKSELMMVGDVTYIEPKFTQDASHVEIRGYDRLHKLRLGKKTKTYLDIKDSDLASQLAGNWGLQADADLTESLFPHLFQNNLSDYEFLKERARRIRYEIGARENTLLFKKPNEAEFPRLFLEYGNDLRVFSASYGVGTAGDTFDVKGWDYMNKEVIEASATSGDELSRMEARQTGAEKSKEVFGAAASVLLDDIPLDEGEAKVLAAAGYNHALARSVNAKGQITGDPAFRISKTLRLSKLGNFSGTYYISKTRHIMDQDGYVTDLEMRRTGL